MAGGRDLLAGRQQVVSEHRDVIVLASPMELVGAHAVSTDVVPVCSLLDPLRPMFPDSGASGARHGSAHRIEHEACRASFLFLRSKAPRFVP
jgi:hypothetical protein